MSGITALRLYVIRSRGREGDELAHKLRGGPVFDAVSADHDCWRTEVMQSEVIPARSDTQTRTPMPKAWHPTQVALVDLATIVDRLDMWDDLRQRATVIIDVHFPLGALARIQSIQPGRNDRTRDRARDAEAQDYWDDPARLARAARVLSEADAVVSPHAGWARLLEHWSTVPRVWERDDAPGSGGAYGRIAVPIAVKVLRDVDSAESGGRFWAELMRITGHAIGRRYARQMSWRRRVLRRVASAIGSVGLFRSVRKTMAAQLAEVDFSYAKVPQ